MPAVRGGSEMTMTDADFATLASGLYLEGLAVDSLRGRLWYSDVIAGGVHGVTVQGAHVATLNPGRMWTGGVMMNADGAVLSTGEGGIMWNDPDSGRSGWLLDRVGGVPINGVNEMTSDGAGGLIFGTSDVEMVVRGGQPRATALYRLTRDREVVRLADEIGFTNGIGYDATRGRLYCNDTFRGTWAFDVEAGSGLTLHNRRLLLEKEDADGLALDAAGNVWITGFRSGSITRMSAEGDVLDVFDTPAAAITQLRFGGADMRDIYINAVPGDAGEMLKEGRPITARASFLCKGRSDAPGLPIAPAEFALD